MSGHVFLFHMNQLIRHSSINQPVDLLFTSPTLHWAKVENLKRYPRKKHLEMADVRSPQHPLNVLSSSLVLVVGINNLEAPIKLSLTSDSSIKPARYLGIRINEIQGRVALPKSASTNMCRLRINNFMTLLMKLKLK